MIGQPVNEVMTNAVDNDVMTAQCCRMKRYATKLEGVVRGSSKMWVTEEDLARSHRAAQSARAARGEPRTLSRPQQARLAQCNAQAQQALRALRLELLTELRADGWQLSELAALMGCSKQRVAVMLRAR